MTRAPNPVLWPEHLLDALTESEKQRLRSARKDNPLSGLDTIDLLHTIACLRCDLVNVNAAHAADMQRINGAMLLQRHDELDARFKADYEAWQLKVKNEFDERLKARAAERECPMGHTGWRDGCVFCDAQKIADAIIPPNRKAP